MRKLATVKFLLPLSRRALGIDAIYFIDSTSPGSKYSLPTPEESRRKINPFTLDRSKKTSWAALLHRGL